LAIDAAKLTHQFGGDEELMREIARMFLEDGEEIMAEIGDAVAAADASAVEQAAHKLKSTLGMLAADAAAATACRLEYLGRRNDLSEVRHLLGELDRQVDQVRRELTALSEPRNEDGP
jgi:HPt (histidine-containing phosphotransfer) domain-containing protein